MKKIFRVTIMAVGVLFWVMGPSGTARANEIQEGKTVRLHYTMSSEGQVVDDTHNRDPLQFVYGKDAILPGLIEPLRGLKAGDTGTITLRPVEAFGEIDPNAVAEVPKKQFQADTPLKPGMVFTSTDSLGRPIRGIVKEVRDLSVVLDFNHPLAGKTIEVQFEVVEVL